MSDLTNLLITVEEPKPSEDSDPAHTSDWSVELPPARTVVLEGWLVVPAAFAADAPDGSVLLMLGKRFVVTGRRPADDGRVVLRLQPAKQADLLHALGLPKIVKMEDDEV